MFAELLGNHGQSFVKLSSAVYPAACDFQVFPLFFQRMVYLIAICDTDSRVILQKLPWVGGVPCFLVFIKDELTFRIHKAGTVDPHPAFTSGWPPVLIYQNRCFIRLYHMIVIQQFVQIIVHDSQGLFTQTNHPVRHVLPGNSQTIAFEFFFKPIQRHCVDVFSIHDSGSQDSETRLPRSSFFGCGAFTMCSSVLLE